MKSQENIINCLFESIDEYIKVDNPYESYIPLLKDDEKLYFIQEENRGSIKIGISKEPEERLKALQTGNSKKLRLLWMVNPKNRSVERNLHKIFNDDRLEREWFEPTELLLRVVLETICHCFDGCWFGSNSLIFND